MFDQKNASVVFDLVAPGQGYGWRRFPRHRPTIPHSGENCHRDEGHDLKTTVEIAETPPAAVPYPPWRRALSDLERVALTVGEVLIPPQHLTEGLPAPTPALPPGPACGRFVACRGFGLPPPQSVNNHSVQRNIATPDSILLLEQWVWHRRSVPAGGGGRRSPARSPKAGRHAARSARGCCARRADGHAQRAGWMVASSARAAPLRAVRCSRRHPQTTL